MWHRFWGRLFSSRRTQQCTRSHHSPQRRRLRLELLEDRVVPSVLDLTGATTSGTINGARFQLANPQPTGSGVIDSFVRLNPGGRATTEQGYNTSGRPLRFDENSSPQFTRDLLLSSVPLVTIG